MIVLVLRVISTMKVPLWVATGGVLEGVGGEFGDDRFGVVLARGVGQEAAGEVAHARDLVGGSGERTPPDQPAGVQVDHRIDELALDGTRLTLPGNEYGGGIRMQSQARGGA
ncbi:hypothetical protein GCM10022419_122830 [Nonomuraea rosea]|uniref:Uncharacterized protein n=1 Tax=Nonomuraea rosea TaxID=638574 RepID=A0ABP6ZQG6_9ACTN